MDSQQTFDVVVVGGGPAGATIANDLASGGRRVLLLDRAGRIKPCGGAIPPRLIRDFRIPDHLLCAKSTSARMISPSGAEVDMPIGNGFVGMVNRDRFDEFLRARAVENGAERRTQWITGDSSGVTATSELTDNWAGLGLDDPAPQAVLVPADYAADPVLLSISEPRWDEERRTLVYEGEQLDDPEPRRAGMVDNLGDDPVGTYTSVTLFIHQPTATDVPSPTTSTTTTTSPSTSTTATTR